MTMLLHAEASLRYLAETMEPTERAREIVARADELDTGTEDCLEPRCALGPQFWEQGAEAFRKDIRLEDCPCEPGPEQDDWLRGWMATELMEFGRFVDEPGAGQSEQKK
jgi:hypothetical protein